MSTSTLIDDQDPQVAYAGHWTKGGTPREHAGTVMSSLVVGDSFTVPFTGTGIAVFGTLDSSSGGVMTSYSIDDGTPVVVTSKAVTGDTYNQQFWQSPTLASTQHKMVVKMVKVNADPADPIEGTVWFDYFQVTNASNQSNSSDSSSTSDGQSSTIHSLPTSSLTSSSTLPSQTNQAGVDKTADDAQKPANNTGPIIAGIVAGVVVFLLVLVLLFLFWRRRKRKQDLDNWIQQKPEVDRNQTYLPNNNLMIPTGYTKLDHPSPPPNKHNPNASSYRPGGSIAPSTISSNYTQPPQAGQSLLYYQNQQPQTQGYNPNAHTFPPSAASSAASNSMTALPLSSDRKPDSKGAGSSLTLAWVPEPIQHVDSGLRVVNGEAVRVDELPPVYTAQ